MIFKTCVSNGSVVMEDPEACMHKELLHDPMHIGVVEATSFP
jgi:hypothetical protein